MPETRQRFDIDQVRERTDLLAVIGQQVALKKRGGRYTGLCPFHQEKTPSFSVDPAKGFWHCFGCGKGGDAFSYLMQLEKLTFMEAVERLAERAGIRPLLEIEPPQRKEERDFLFEVNAAAADAFRKALRGRAGEQARAYLARRGITAEHADRFGLGYAPAGWDALVSHLGGRNFGMPIMVKAGLALARTSGEGHIDRFRNRLMIPIYDRRNRVIAFGGRALTAQDQPKYLNTAETPIFHKGQTLYALNLAGDAIGKRGRAIITEGYFDAIACHLAGFAETVATLGTALGEEHVQILRRLAERIYLVFDADSAGVNAALRSQALFREAGADVRIVRLPDGHDPDTLLREKGTDAFERCLAEALSPVEFELELLVRQHPEQDAEGRVRLFRAAAKILHPLPALERAEYAARLVDRWLGGSRGDVMQLQQAMLSEVAALDHGPRRRPAATTPAPSSEAPAADLPLERELMTAMVQDQQFASRAVAQIPPDAFAHPAYRAVFEGLRGLAAAGKPADARRIVSADDQLVVTIAALAVREPLPVEDLSPDAMAKRMCEEYEERQDRQPSDIDDPDALQAWTMRLRQRKQRNARRIFGLEE